MCELREATPTELADIRGAFEQAGVVLEGGGKWVGAKIKVKGEVKKRGCVCLLLQGSI
jgi:hypothetical protein